MTQYEEEKPSCDPVALTQAAEGSALCFCNSLCLVAFGEAAMPGAPLRRWAVPAPEVASCIHCFWCGHLISDPEYCPLHDDDCPTTNWGQTLQGLGAHAALAGHVHDEIIPHVLAALEHAGRRHPELDGHSLVRRILGGEH